MGESSARAVGVVLAAHGHDVAWWRVVLSDGRPAPVGRERALAELAAEGVQVVSERVVLAQHRWSGPGLSGRSGLPPLSAGD